MKEKIIKILRWFGTKHGIIVDCFITCAIFATVQYYTYDPVSFVFQILALIAISPVAIYIIIQGLIGIPVNMIRKREGETRKFIIFWTKLQMWFNKPWSPYDSWR